MRIKLLLAIQQRDLNSGGDILTSKLFGKKWGDYEFILYAYFGSGIDVKLRETGHLSGVMNYYFYDLGVMQKINRQIIQKAKELGSSGYFEYFFEKSYSFKEYQWCFGGSTIKGKFKGNAIYHYNHIHITGYIDYEYYDIFTDPADIRQVLIGTSNLDPDEMAKSIKEIEESEKRWEKIKLLIWKFLRTITMDKVEFELIVNRYYITDKWKTNFEAEALREIKGIY
ncbi:putative phage head domain-containing protein [Candidatus Cyrtobacter comes]|uniref:Phage head domain-containing protein n=1 Tax=Candidatus Cyrtobacter comes TaxID=675776 RepID=A0ABU5L869_9RICK|nr:hypothetical protein [Candidatus Cyrtobacter comes]MDZ5762070.1 putative phage head domain-containing protein [Candidatus Cyrtobacter comes]